MFCLLDCFAQSDKPKYKRSLDLSLGRYKHGSGDLKGAGFILQYNKEFKKRLFWSIGLGATLHDGSVPISYSNNGEVIDGSIRYTTGGLQSDFSIGYSLISATHSRLQLKLGSILRYQSSSYYDEYSIYFPIVTGLPFPVVEFKNTSPQRTFSIGGITDLSYKYVLQNNMLLGTGVGLQIDSNGDVLTNISLIVGIQMK